MARSRICCLAAAVLVVRDEVIDTHGLSLKLLWALFPRVAKTLSGYSSAELGAANDEQTYRGPLHFTTTIDSSSACILRRATIEPSSALKVICAPLERRAAISPVAELHQQDPEGYNPISDIIAYFDKDTYNFFSLRLSVAL